MTTALRLPFSLNSLPEDYANVYTITAAQQDDRTLLQLQAELNQFKDTQVIIGSYKTPLLWWLASQQAFPSAQLLCSLPNKQWQVLSLPENISFKPMAVQASDTTKSTSDATPAVSSSSQNAQPIANKQTTAETQQIEIQATQTENKPKTSEQAPTPKSEQDTIEIRISPNEWIHKVFLHFAWGDSNAEKLLDNYLQQSFQLKHDRAQIASRLKQAAKKGKQANKYGNQVTTLVQQNNTVQAEEIVAELENKGISRQVINYVRHKIKRTKSFIATKREQAKNKHKVQLAPVALIDDKHPQSLSAAKPSAQWTILIDETGNKFDNDYDDVAESDIGRIVALILPQSSNLKRLDQKTHSTDLSDANVEKLITSIVNSNSSVLGASLKGVLSAHSWMASIDQLMRWLLLMLPLKTSGTANTVKILIEQRSGYAESAQLTALCDAIESELKILSPEKYGNLRLHLEIMDKDNPYNGYVDAIANCWGSQQKFKKQLLTRTRWKGFCLFDHGDVGELESLYRRVGTGEITAADWFELCDFAAKEEKGSLLNTLLNDLGETSQQRAGQWQIYLRETQHRIHNKNFNAASLNRALAWLEQFQPDNTSLPPRLQLQLASSSLAAANHKGETNLALVKQCLDLSNQLFDEAAVECCEAVLRIAISASHVFDFDNAITWLEQWKSHPVAAIGLVNHGKIYSSLGQLYAFAGESIKADDHFTRALEIFRRISDPAQRNREIAQSQNYQLINIMDLRGADAKNELQATLMAAAKSSQIQYAKKLATSGDELRFEHYILLRYLVLHDENAEERSHYLGKQEEWSQGEGHPWMLINAYRAWLLAQTNDSSEEAASYMQMAIDECADAENGPILHWMAHCLTALGKSLNLKVSTPDVVIAEVYPSAKLKELEQADTHQARAKHLSNLLPFNFH